MVRFLSVLLSALRLGARLRPIPSFRLAIARRGRSCPPDRAYRLYFCPTKTIATRCLSPHLVLVEVRCGCPSFFTPHYVLSDILLTQIAPLHQSPTTDRNIYIYTERLLSTRCPSIYYTPPPNKRPEPTSSSASYRARIAFLWTSSVPAVFKSPPYSATHNRSYSAARAMLCFVSPREDGLDSRKDAVIERRSIKEFGGETHVESVDVLLILLLIVSVA